MLPMEETSFGRYVLRELVGEGGMGQVYRAYDTVTKRDVALKVLPARAAADPESRQRFEREAHRAAQLDEPHVVPIYDYGEIAGRLFLSMRLIRGDDVASMLRDRGPMPPELSVMIIEQVASALDAAHTRNVVHRDVKPSNILVTESMFAYLIDFGLARALTDTSLTSMGATVGTFAYMAPERLMDDESDGRADTYALACVLHECLTATRPFPSDSLERCVSSHLYSPPPRPSVVRPGVPVLFDAVIARGMAKNPADRFPTSGALARAARAALPGRPHPGATARAPAPATVVRPAPYSAPPPPIPPIRRRKRTVLFALVGVVVIAAGVVAAVVSTRDDSTGSTASAPEKSSPTVQVTLAFGRLNNPNGVAVDKSGTVYVTDPGDFGVEGDERVLELRDGGASPTELPFDARQPAAVAVDEQGMVYVTDYAGDRVLKLSGNTPLVLAFGTLDKPSGVAVAHSGTVCVTDTGTNSVYCLPAGGNSATKVGFTDLVNPTGIAVSGDNFYVTDTLRDRVVEKTPDSTEPMSFSGLNYPTGIAVDPSGAVYVADFLNNRVLRLDKGASTATELPFTGLTKPTAIAIDESGAVYVADQGNSRIVKLGF